MERSITTAASMEENIARNQQFYRQISPISYLHRQFNDLLEQASRHEMENLIVYAVLRLPRGYTTSTYRVTVFNASTYIGDALAIQHEP